MVTFDVDWAAVSLVVIVFFLLVAAVWLRGWLLYGKTSHSKNTVCGNNENDCATRQNTASYTIIVLYVYLYNNCTVCISIQ